MKMKTYLSPIQVLALSSSSFFPLTFWIFPRIVVEHAQSDAQWAILGVVLVGVFIGWIQGLLNERFPTMTGADFYSMVFGKWIGKLITLVYVPIYLLFVSLCICLFVYALKAYFPATPRIVLVLALCLIAMRGAWHGVETLGRVSSVVHPLTWLGVVIVFGFIAIQAKWHWMTHTVTSWPHLFAGVYYMLPIYLGFNLFLMLSPYYQHKKKRSIWYAPLSALAGGIAIIMAFLAIYFNIGLEASTGLTFGIPFALQLIRLNGWIVERLGILIIIFATAYTTLFVSNHIWAISTLTARILNFSDHQYKRMVLPVSIPIIWIAIAFDTEQAAFDVITKYFVPASWILLLGSPLLALIVAILRGLRTTAIPMSSIEQDAVANSPLGHRGHNHDKRQPTK